MANNTTKKTTQNKKATSAKQVVEKAKVETNIVPKDIDDSQYITVVNGSQGKLVYVSPRTKEVFVWDGFGDEQEIELRELRNAKSSAKGFFLNNWFMFKEEDAWVIDYLGLHQFYASALPIGDFDGLFEKPIPEIKKIVSGLSDGQKKSVSYRATQLVTDGTIDSRKTIMALEEALGIELIEK
jgi:hypothetical protein